MDQEQNQRILVLGITGASGAGYAVRLLDVLLAAGRDVYLSISPAGRAVIKEELGATVDLDDFDAASLSSTGLGFGEWRAPADAGIERPPGRIHYCHYRDLMAPIASGSFLTAGMVVCPCSGSTLGAISHAMGTNLIHRAAEVHLKERRKLVLVPRETPLSLVQLDNMRRAAEAGAIVLPASPGFYHAPATIADLIDFVVGRICDQLGVEQNLIQRWGEGAEKKNVQ
ncbi:MAG TPA: flavin prenyltransferase UbiX [Pirellulales bacterium]|jgi:4-hydroxy-3-polyprenylbenzoate decarboxylase|nr:flavin prenyltransferase UbiX [Pirellulales bacterium]